MNVPKKQKLGEILIHMGLISEDDLNNAIKTQKEKGGRLGDILLQSGKINAFTLAKAMSEQLKIPFIDLMHYTIKPEIVQRLPERVVRRHRVILLDVLADGYIVGMCDPTDLIAYDELSRVLEGKLVLSIVTEEDFNRVIDLVYRRTEDISSFAAELKDELAKTTPKTTGVDSLAADSAPVVKLLDSIFEDAVQMGASDVHIEPDEKFLRLRLRIDGELHENILKAKEIVAALVLRIKLMSNLNISEKRMAQDGRFRIKVKGHIIDVRVSTMPVRHGESVVMRLLDQSSGILTIDQLGMPKHILERIKILINKPYGMLLVTGPTGSGKTTTLYGILDKLNAPENKIVTIEDPVEYELPRLSQIQVNPDINFSFGTILRSTLRQDPDVIMIGEMRDEETVSIGLRSAITGHIVLSTLHTNDSVGTAIRLMDMGAQGYLVASALMGVLAQRLVRKICASCVMEYKPNAQEEVWLKAFLGKFDPNVKFKCGAGCSKCGKSGYRGRVGVYEFLEMDSELADALRENNTTKFMHLAKERPNFKTLSHCALDYAISGLTTLSEVFKVAEEIG